MDQTINEMMYKGRINSTIGLWKEQLNGKMTSGGTLIGNDGTSYKKIDGRLVPVVDPHLLKRVAKKVIPNLEADGLIKSNADDCVMTSAVVSEELVNEI